ncbi:MocR-like pyridoxine biosynthesis transcription factor PdxR [Actinacidiphila acidipaludis]|uniref:PLP-dependent aminotransferase family protein n=1 Tax=Actinacidiphila acidipaludis TaxID=2873382 RepID=A0ABS7Q5D4_9ACTN|nr:PLP-dependent aminotransferase family protein [Streptomyces acidipaludis]MBY8878368.1 PLP-dependent aminotransferase family protein [Streptomyces acidipaludis]
MPLEWSGLSPELLLTLDRESTEGLRTQLERQIRDAIRAGRLQVGERLPSSRALARGTGVSRGLVQECYAQLQAEGYLAGRVGAATTVAARACPQPAASRAATGPPAAAPAAAAPSGGVAAAAAPPGPRLIADFRTGVPDLGAFPLTDWLWAVREAGRTLPTAALDYGTPHGAAELREVVAGYQRRVRAAAADPGRTVICSGYAQGLALVLRALAGRGVRTLAFEDPGAPGATSQAAAQAGMTAVPVPVDEDGIDVRALDATGAGVVLVTPAHQWPTGVVMAAGRRRALIAWARRRDAFVVEDDYDAEFRYDREPVGSLQGLAADRVVGVGTVSKSLAPALRLGWLLCPPALLDAVVAHKAADDRGSPTLDQLALARLIASGRYDRHLRRMRTLYAARRSALVAALAAHAPGVRLTGLAAGFHAVAHLDPGRDEDEVVAAARARGVGLYGMAANRSAPAGPGDARLVLGFGNVGERAITEGVAAVGDVLAG